MVAKPNERQKNQGPPIFHLQSLPTLEQKVHVQCGKEITGEASSMSQTSSCFAGDSCLIISFKVFVKVTLEKNYSFVVVRLDNPILCVSSNICVFICFPPKPVQALAVFLLNVCPVIFISHWTWTPWSEVGKYSKWFMEVTSYRRGSLDYKTLPFYLSNDQQV